MRIALLTPFQNRELGRSDDYFLLKGWEQALAGYDTYRLSRFDEPRLEVRRTLSSFDLGLVIPSAAATGAPKLGENALASAGVTIIDGEIHPDLKLFRPEWFVPATALAESIPKPVFSPSREHLGLSREIYTQLNRWQPTLFMANEAAEIRKGVAPGFRTLFAPFFPDAHLAALASASFLVTLNKTTALAAASLRVPVLFVTGSEDESEAMVRLGMETIVFGPHEPASAIAKRVKTKAANGLPLVTETTVQAQLAKEANRVAAVFSPRPSLFAEAEAPLRVACMADWRYVPFLLGLASNLRSVHAGAVQLHVLALDEKTEKFLKGSPLLGGGATYRLENLWDAEALAILKQRSLAYQAYTCKPKLLQSVLDTAGGPALYCDLDIFYYESPLAWVEALGEKAVRVCPQRNDSIESDRYYGFFQAGLVAVNERAKTFLAWWGKLSYYKCLNTRQSHDYFMEDQGYLDLAPVLFAEFGIDWSGEQNVACWNLNAFCATPDPQTPWRPLVGEVSGKSLHAAHPDRLGFCHAKAVWDQLSVFFSAYPESDADELLPQVISAQAAHLSPLCAWFELEHHGQQKLRLPKFFTRHPKRLLALWHSPLNGVATWLAQAALDCRTLIRKRTRRARVAKPPKLARWRKKRGPILNWAETVATLIQRRQEIERLAAAEGVAAKPLPRSRPSLESEKEIPLSQ